MLNPVTYRSHFKQAGHTDGGRWVNRTKDVDGRDFKPGSGGGASVADVADGHRRSECDGVQSAANASSRRGPRCGSLRDRAAWRPTTPESTESEGGV